MHGSLQGQGGFSAVGDGLVALLQGGELALCEGQQSRKSCGLKLEERLGLVAHGSLYGFASAAWVVKSRSAPAEWDATCPC